MVDNALILPAENQLWSCSSHQSLNHNSFSAGSASKNMWSKKLWICEFQSAVGNKGSNLYKYL